MSLEYSPECDMLLVFLVEEGEVADEMDVPMEDVERDLLFHYSRVVGLP